jgi:tetratricopeptide (TPR) repeat protein
MELRFAAGLLACLLMAPAGLAQEGTPGDAQGDAPPKDEVAAPGTDDVSASPLTPPYAVDVQRGMRLVLARDFDGAIDTLRQAIKRDPQRPEAHYYMGVAQGMQNEPKEAIGSFETAARMARDDRAWKARALVAVAWMVERIGAQRPELAEGAGPKVARINEPQLARARDAWERVRQLADADGPRDPIIDTAVSVATERQRAIDEVLATEERTVPVRQRIADREKQKAEEEAKDGK